MIPVRPSMLVLTLALAAGECSAEVLSDPMQPPAFAVPSGGTSSTPSPSGPVLQSTLLSEGRRIAMIDGKPMQVGDRIGEARIVAIGPASVTLRGAGTTRVLELYQGVRITGAEAKNASASRKALHKGTK